MHWGIHSVVGAQPSWDMISNYRYGGKVAPPDKYYALADQFNPQNYDPDKWLKAAKEAGFTYAVLTTKHHDGYALWPSKYGIGTKQYMNGREDGIDKGEHAAILYKKDRFTLLDSGDFWLRENPEKPGLGWDATCCNRICSWGKFKDLETSKVFFLFCVHFDHQGVVARIESGKLMVKKIREIAGKKPVICVGDFNSTPETEQIKTMQTLFKDSRQASTMPPYGPVGTFNGFKFDSPLTELIDYIFVSSTIDVMKYGVLTDNVKRRYPSDHLPVVAKMKIN